MRIQINRPEKRNALSQEMYAVMTQSLVRADDDDLVEFLDHQDFDEDSPMLRFVCTLPFVKKPIIAAVNGAAVGVGVTMLLHCDLVFASENAQFQMPFVNFGLVPEAGSSLLLPQLIGYQRAAELLLLGNVFGSKRAYELGLVNRVCADDTALAIALDAAKELAIQPAAAVCMTKALMKGSQVDVLKNRIKEEATLFVSRLKSPETKTALRSFMEKRKLDVSRFE